MLQSLALGKLNAARQIATGWLDVTDVGNCRGPLVAKSLASNSSEGGSMLTLVRGRVEMLDASEQPLPGFTKGRISSHHR